MWRVGQEAESADWVSGGLETGRTPRSAARCNKLARHTAEETAEVGRNDKSGTVLGRHPQDDDESGNTLIACGRSVLMSMEGRSLRKLYEGSLYGRSHPR